MGNSRIQIGFGRRDCSMQGTRSVTSDCSFETGNIGPRPGRQWGPTSSSDSAADGFSASRDKYSRLGPFNSSSKKCDWEFAARDPGITSLKSWCRHPGRLSNYRAVDASLRRMPGPLLRKARMAKKTRDRAMRGPRRPWQRPGRVLRGRGTQANPSKA